MWKKVTDFRDDVGHNPNGKDRYVRPILTGDMIEDNVYPLPDGCHHFWRYDDRWICE